MDTTCNKSTKWAILENQELMRKNHLQLSLKEYNKVFKANGFYQ